MAMLQKGSGMFRQKSNKIDMLHGPIFPKLMMFMLPLALSNALQLLFNAADVVVVGRYAGALALAAVGATTSVIAMLVNFFNGISMGANILISREYAAENHDIVSGAVHTAMSFALLVGIVLAGAGQLLARQILLWISVPAEILEWSRLYLRIYFLGMPALLTYNMGAAALRSVGDTRRPMYYLFFSGVVNVLLNLLLVIRFQLGVAGVAIATVVSGYLSCLLVIRALVLEDSSLRLDFRRLGIQLPLLGEIMKYGLPGGIQSCTFGLTNVMIQSAVNTFGPIYIAGNAAAQSIEGFIVTILSGMLNATLTFTGQNAGAGRYSRVDSILRQSMLGGMALMLVVGTAAAIFRHPLIAIYNKDPEVIAVGGRRLLITGLVYFAEIPMTTYSSSLRGLGITLPPMLISVVFICLFRVLWLLIIFPLFPYYETVIWVWPFSWLVTIGVYMIAYPRLRGRFPKEDVSRGA